MSTNVVTVTIQEKRSEYLDPSIVDIKDVIVHHEDKSLRRTFPLKSKDGKPYYVTTDYLEPDSIAGRSLIKNGMSGEKYTKYIVNIKQKCNDTDNINELFKNLSTFRRGLTNRLKYLGKIPDYSDDLNISMSVNTIKLDNSIMIRNIIEYKDQKNNFGIGHLNRVLKQCRCKILMRIDSMIITNKNVYLNIFLLRVYPETIDVLDAETKFFVLEQLNKQSIQNMQRYDSLSNIVKHKPSNKHVVRDELVKLLVKAPLPSDKNKFKRTSQYKSTK